MKLLLSIIVFFLLLDSIIGHVLLNYPKGGELFTAGTEITIEWDVIVYHGPASFDLLYSDDGGVSWEEISIGINENNSTYNWIVPNLESTKARIKVLQVNTGTNYLSDSDNFTIRTATNIGESEITPYSFKLNNPYPNPFNSRSVISFQLSKSGASQLLIYNMLGQKIETLINEVLTEGEYNYNWDASPLSSGTYVVFLKSGSFTESKNIILMK